MHKSKILTALLMPACLLAACGGGGSEDREPQVRLIHSAEKAADITALSSSGQQINAGNLSYKGASPFVNFGEGSQEFTLKNQATGAQIGGKVAFNAQRGHRYSMFAIPTANDVEPILVDDPDIEKRFFDGVPRFRFLHAAFNTGKVDVFFHVDNKPLQADSKSFFTADFKQSDPASGSDSRRNLNGDLRMFITPAGSKTAIFAKTIRFEVGSDYLFTAVPLGGVGHSTLNQVKVLLTRTYDGGQTVDELVSDPL